MNWCLHSPRLAQVEISNPSLLDPWLYKTMGKTIYTIWKNLTKSCLYFGGSTVGLSRKHIDNCIGVVYMCFDGLTAKPFWWESVLHTFVFLCCAAKVYTEQNCSKWKLLRNNDLKSLVLEIERVVWFFTHYNSFWKCVMTNCGWVLILTHFFIQEFKIDSTKHSFKNLYDGFRNSHKILYI